MRLATYSLQTYERPALLRECLDHIQRQALPDGWELEVVVAAPRGDPGIAVAKAADGRPYPVKVVISPASNIGAQQATRLAASRGDVVLQTGDDDLQRSDRAMLVLSAYAGRPVGFDRFMYVSVLGKHVARWDGPSHRAGASIAIPGEWCEVAAFAVDRSHAVGGDINIQDALASEGMDISDYDDIDCDMVCISHGSNVSGKQPWPRRLQRVKRGDFWVVGDEWPRVEQELEAHTVEAIDRLCAAYRR